MLDARLLECVRGRRQLFRDLSFSVGPGDYVELRGPNGSGKTSLLRILCGLLPPTSGAVLWQGRPIGFIRDLFLASVAYVGHRPAVKDELTVMENLRMSSALNGCGIARDHARTALERVGLAGPERTPARRLSEGQRRRLALARLIVIRRRLWLLDEVGASLDADAGLTLEAFVREHLADGGMAVAATHQQRLLGVTHARCIELAA